MRTFIKRVLTLLTVMVVGFGTASCTDSPAPPTSPPPSTFGSVERLPQSSGAVSASPSTAVLGMLPQVELKGAEPTAPPVWKDGGASTDFMVQLLLYAQGLARRARLSVKAVYYSVLQPNQQVECSDSGGVRILAGSRAKDIGLAYCSNFQGVVVVSVPGAQATTVFQFDLALAVYADALAVANGQVGASTDRHALPNAAYSACVHGVLVKQQLDEGALTLAAARERLVQSAGGRISEAGGGFLSGHC